MTPAFHAIAEMLALRAIQSLAVGALVTVFAAIVLRVSRQSAGTRFAVWFSSLIAIAVFPFVGGRWLGNSSASLETRAAITLPDSWAIYSIVVWAVLASWFLFGVARAVWHVRRLRKSCSPVDAASIDPVLRQTLQHGSTQRNVVLCTSATVRVPTAIGFFKPAIVIPDWVMQELSTVEINQILIHELAHLRRWDDWTNLAQQLVKALFFFHPAVWWVEKKAALEREMACDDAVLETASPRAYAECLARLAEKSVLQRSVALAQAAIGKIRQTSLRVAQILDPDRPSASHRALKPAVALVALFAVATAVSVDHGPRLIAFGSNTPAPVDGSVATSTSPVMQSVSGRNTARAFDAVIRSTQKVGITPANLVLGTGHSKFQPNVLPGIAQVEKKRAEISRSHDKQAVRLVRAEVVPVPVTETMFLVIESRGVNSPVYQIQMWHVTVLRMPVNTVDTQVLHKEI
jgi:beta-lactamase regulating signal transducer with metallopeptidase domain